jgi:H/ACA ribonucleoprotein complex subunit 3
MKHRIKRCKVCHQYTLKEICPLCKKETNDPHPPKFSLEDKYIRYRVIDAHKK